MKVVVGGVETTLAAGQTLRGSRSSAEVDVVLVFDTTGSMSGCIDGMRRAMVAFADALEKKELDWRLVCVPFGDLKITGDRIVTELQWVQSVNAARSQLAGMPRFAGGGNGGESSYEALMAGLDKKCRRDAMRVVVLITDDMPHQDTHSTPRVKDALVSADALMYVVTHHTHPYEPLATATGGARVPLTDGRNVDQIISVLTSFADSLAKRCRQVLELGGGSPQRLIAIERGQK